MTKVSPLSGMKTMGLATRLLGILLRVVGFSGTLMAQEELRLLMEQHCYQCHGAEKQKGGLRLDTLEAPSGAGQQSHRWLEVLEVLANGEMPPKKEKQPPAEQRKAVVRQLRERLSEGLVAPIGLRRMNRTEYESTVQDLLGITVGLQELLPEDGEVDGFDNVSDGLGISSILMERYLEAADVAFEAVIRRFAPLEAQTRRMQVMEGRENLDSVAKKKGGVIEVEGALVKFTPGWPPVRIDQVHPIEDGSYRCRVAVWPYQPGERTLAMAVYVGPLFGDGKRRFMGMYDVTGTPENPRVIDFVAELKEGETIHLVPWVYPDHVTWRDMHEKQPGIGVVWAETHGPLNQDFPSEAQKRLFGESKSLSMKPYQSHWMRHRKGVELHEVISSDPQGDAQRIIRAFVPRAFRRPVPQEVADPYVELTLNLLAEGRSFEQAVRAGVCAILCSPQFLLINQEEVVDDYAVASRLSYFLWSSLPDEELMHLAKQGKLKDPSVRALQVERMLNSRKRERFIKNFTGQWLDLREIEFTTPSSKLYPEFDPMLQQSMVRETEGFFRHILDHDLSVMNFVDSDFAVLNERIARHYGIDTVKGHEHSRVVALAPESIRGGLMGQASILKVTANGTTTSPVMRGVWLLENLLDRPSPPPPPGIPAVEPDIRGATSIREQLAKHREEESCARCHRQIDPPGFALECFDPIGGERSWYRSLGEGKRISKREPYTIGPDVVIDGELSEGERFADFQEFRALLLQREEQILRGIAKKLLVYGSGRPMTLADESSVNFVVAQARQKNLGLKSMVQAVVESEMFQRR